MNKFTKRDIIVIELLLEFGFSQDKIASLFDRNQGRISEVANRWVVLNAV